MKDKFKLMLGDNIESLKKLPDNSVDSVVTDPPYGLSFMNKKWDHNVPSIELWKEVYRVLKPGGHVLSFGGTRTYHRMVVNIEDAGFEIRDQIMWIYGSGFPKSHNIGKAVDKLQGNEREVVGKDICGKRENQISEWGMKQGEYLITKGNSEYEGWGTALKPANEPICLARKPLSEDTIAMNVLKWGTGGINIEGCRIGTEMISHGTSRADIRGGSLDGSLSGSRPRLQVEEVITEGRFPTNIIFDESAAKILDEQSVINKGNGASRFFYIPKISTKERSTHKNIHPTVKPIQLMTYLCRLITPPNGIVLDPFMGSGSTGISACLEGFKFVGMELDPDYFKTAETRIDNYELYREFTEKKKKKKK